MTRRLALCGSADGPRSEQRRMAVVSALASVWVLGLAALGAVEALGYLAPTLALVALLVLGRYPGADAIERRSRRSSRRVRRAAPATVCPRPRAPGLSSLRLLVGSIARRGPPLPGTAGA